MGRYHELSVQSNEREQLSPEQVLDLLSDSHSRSILAATAQSPTAVPDLVEHSTMSSATAYRKVNQLVEAGLLEATVCVRPGGKNFRKFSLGVERVHVTLAKNGVPRLRVSLHPTAEADHSTPVHPL